MDEFGNRKVIAVMKGALDTENINKDYFQTSTPVINDPMCNKLQNFNINVADIGKEQTDSGRCRYYTISTVKQHDLCM